MQTLGELVGAGLVAFMFLTLTNQGVKNSGSLPKSSLPKASEADEEKYVAAPADAKSRSADDVCVVKPPEMISTSLLPNNTTSLEDADFLAITPDKLKHINFLNTGWALGRDTTSNTMRNASYDLRSEMPNPRLLNPNNNSFANSTISFQPKRSFEPEQPSEKLDKQLDAQFK